MPSDRNATTNSPRRPPRGRREEHDPSPDPGRRRSTPFDTHLRLLWDTATPLLAITAETPGPEPGPSRGPGPRKEAREEDAERARTLAMNAGHSSQLFRTALVLFHARQPRLGPEIKTARVDLVFLDRRYAIARLPTAGSPDGVWLRFRPPNPKDDRHSMATQLREALLGLSAQAGLCLGGRHPPRLLTYATTSGYSSAGRAIRPETAVAEWTKDRRRIGSAVERLARELGTKAEEITDTPRLLLHYRLHFLVTSIMEAVQWSLDETLELLLPALNGIPNATAFAGATDRLRQLHSLRPMEVAEATTWLAALCATFAPTDRPEGFIRNLLYRVCYAFVPTKTHARGARPPRPSHPQDALKEPWVACARARATVMRGDAPTAGGRTADEVCTPCADTTRSPGSDADITRGLLHVVARPCRLAAQAAAQCASLTTGEELLPTDTPLRCSLFGRCRFTGDRCHPEMTPGLAATLPAAPTSPAVPVRLPDLLTSQPLKDWTEHAEQHDAEGRETEETEVQVIDLRGTGNAKANQPLRTDRHRPVSARTERGRARVTTRSPTPADARDTIRRRRKRKGGSQNLDGQGSRPRGRRKGDVYRLSDGLRRTFGVTCGYCKRNNHTKADCQVRQLDRTRKKADTSDARTADESSPDEGGEDAGARRNRTHPPSPTRRRTGPIVACCRTDGPPPSDADSYYSDGARSRIYQSDGTYDVPDLTDSDEGTGPEDEETDMPSAPLTQKGYQLTAMVADRPYRFLIDTGMTFSCITRGDLQLIQQNAPEDTIRPTRGGEVTARLFFPRLGTRRIALRVVPDDSGYASSLGWDTLTAWGAYIEFVHDTCSCPPDHPHLAVVGACAPLGPEDSAAPTESPFR